MVVLSVIPGCADDPPALGLSEGGDAPDWGSHRRRLNIHIINSNGAEEEWEPGEFYQELATECIAELGQTLTSCPSLWNPSAPPPWQAPPPAPTHCYASACNAQLQLCAAHRFMELATAAGETAVGTVVVPPQSRATRAGFAEDAARAAREAAISGMGALRKGANLAAATGTCSPGSGYNNTTSSIQAYNLDDALFYVPAGEPAAPLIGETLASSIAEGFWLMREASEATFRDQLAVADEQYSTQASLPRANRYAYDAPVLSRGHVAAFLLGNNNSDPDVEEALPDLEGSPMCPTQIDTPAARIAESVMQEAGIHPMEVLNPSIDIDQLVAGTTPAHSVAERLRNQYGAEAIPVGGDIFGILGADREAFIRAREALAQRITVFDRSMTATMPVRTVVGSGVAQNESWPRYAAVATNTAAGRPARWTALARKAPTPYAGTQSGMSWYANGPASSPTLARRSITHAADFVYTGVRELLYRDGAAAPPLAFLPQIHNALAPLLVQSDSEHHVRIEAIAGQGGSVAYVFVVHRNQGQFRLVRGHDGRSCAVDGHVDGLDCDLNDYMVSATGSSSVWSEQSYGFPHYTYWPLSIGTTDRPLGVASTTYEVVALPPSAVDELPGSFDGYGSITIPTTPAVDFYDSYSPNEWAEALAAEALEPDPEACAIPRTGCAGLPLDQRIPLENELSEDGNGFESSWRNYLNLARQAADEADALGEELVRQGLEMDIRAEAALDDLAEQCGGSVNVDQSGTFGPDADVDEYGTNPCSAGCAENEVCHAGACVLSPVDSMLNQPGSEDSPDEARVRACMGDLGESKFVTLGSKHLCVYVNNANFNDVCPETEGECPYFATTDAAGDPLCNRPVNDPGVYETHLAEPLGLFLSEEGALGGGHEDDPVARSEVCAAFRRVRTADTPDWSDLLTLRETRVFDPDALEDYARSLEWRPEPLNVAMMRRNGENWFGTGTLRDGYGLAWPCGPQDASFGCGEDNDEGLFCGRVNQTPPMGIDECESPHDRWAFNYRMGAAVLAAKVLAGSGLKGMRWPIYLDTQGDAADLDGNRVNVQVHPTLAASGLIRAPQVTFECPSREKKYTSGSSWNAASFFSENPSNPDPLWYELQRGTGTVIGHLGSSNYPLAFVDLSSEREPNAAVEVAYFFGNGLGARENSDVREYDNLFQILLSPQTESSIVLTPLDLRSFTVRFKDSPEVCDPHRNNEGNLMHIAPDGLTRQMVLDGMELLCELPVRRNAVSMEVDPNCDPNNPPVVETIDDTERLREYMSCTADQIQQRGERTVFANVPERVIEVLANEGGVGIYPELGGQYADAVASLRRGFIEMQGIPRMLSFEVRGFSEDIQRIELAMRALEIREQLNGLRLTSAISSNISRCAADLARIGGAKDGRASRGLVAAATCADAVVQIAVAVRTRALDDMLLDIEGETRLSDLVTTLQQRLRSLDTVMEAVRVAQEQIDAGLSGLESTRSRARRAVARATFADTDETGRQYNVNTVMRRRLNTTQVRYERARMHAVRMAWLAKLALEQRLGLNLADLDEDMSLVEAPAGWHMSVCTSSAIDYSRLRDAGALEYESYDGAYVGDYVRKLEAVVESYRLDHPFSDGRDTAIVSLRDDVKGTRALCDEQSENLLAYSSQLDVLASEPGELGWEMAGCLPITLPGETDDSGNPIQGITHCVASEVTGGRVAREASPGFGSATARVVVFGDPDAAGTPGATISFDPSTSYYFQRFVAEPGRQYRLSWFATKDENDGALAVRVLDPALANPRTAPIDGPQGLEFDSFQEVEIPSWSRYYRFFDTYGHDTSTEVHIAILPQGTGTSQLVEVTGLMLEDVTGSTAGLTASNPEAFPPRLYQDTRRERTVKGRVCEDVDGDVFRLNHWRRVCEAQCPVGLSSCPEDVRTSRCFWETNFSVSPEGVESGNLLGPSGFARGNYNYRVDRMALNVVGTAVQNCEASESPSACYSAGYVPYSLEHWGPYFVRDHDGNTSFEANLFTGRIVHGRAVAAERYITNPLSAADRALVEPYSHAEMQGRPLAGNYRLRLWDDESLQFEQVEDVQIVLDYRYWTRLD